MVLLEVNLLRFDLVTEFKIAQQKLINTSPPVKKVASPSC